MEQSKRSFNIDLLRIFAFFTVTGVHFFYNTSFYQNPIEGFGMVISVFIREFFMVCVPLFLVMTGYLQCGKDIEFDKKWIVKLLKVIIPYLIITILVWAFGITFRIQPYINRNLFEALFGFTNNGYGWYMEMYIGLFLLIPFLNKIWIGLKEKNKKQGLIGVLGLLVFIPAVANAFETLVLDYWMQPLYPIIYYFIGCYLKEYGLKIGKLGSWLLIISGVGLSGSAILLTTEDKLFFESTGAFYFSLFVGMTVIGVANLFLKKNTEQVGDKVRSAVAKLADSVYAAYLFSVITDLSIYYIFDPLYGKSYELHLAFGLLYVIMSFGLSLIFGRIITVISGKIIFSINKRKERKKA